MTGPAVAAPPASPEAAPQPVVPAAPAAAPAVPQFGAQPEAGPSANQLIDAFHASKGKAGAQNFAGNAAEQAAAQNAPPSGAAPPAPAPDAAAAGAPAPAGVTDPSAAPVPDSPGATADAPAANGEEQPAEPLIARLPGRNPGEPEMEVEIDDPVLYDRINQLRNSAMRGDEARRVRDAGQRALQEAAEVAELIQTDAVGFIGQHLPPEQQAEIALGTLLNPAIWGELKPVLQALLQSDDAARTARSEFEVRRLQMKEQARLAGEERRSAGANAEQLTQGIARITPNLPPEQVGIFQNDMRTYLREYVNHHGLRFVPTEQLPAILAPRLAAWGINPAAAAQRLFSQDAPAFQRPSQHPAQPRNGGAPPRAPAPAPAAPAAPGQQFLRSAQAKAGLAAGAPPGAGASALAIPTVPKKMSIKQAANWLREQAGVSRPQ